MTYCIYCSARMFSVDAVLCLV